MNKINQKYYLAIFKNVFYYFFLLFILNISSSHASYVSIRVDIKTYDSNIPLSLYIYQSWTILKLKKEIETKKSILVKKQHLIFEGIDLLEGNKVIEYGIEYGDMIHMVPALGNPPILLPKVDIPREQISSEATVTGLPYYYRVYKGLNIAVRCERPSCSINGKLIWASLKDHPSKRIGKFTISGGDDDDFEKQVICPVCNTQMRYENMHGYGFMKCKFYFECKTPKSREENYQDSTKPLFIWYPKDENNINDKFEVTAEHTITKIMPKKPGTNGAEILKEGYHCLRIYTEDL